MNTQDGWEVDLQRARTEKNAAVAKRRNKVKLYSSIFFTHLDSTEDDTLVTVHGPLPYLPMSPACYLIDLLGPNQKDVKPLHRLSSLHITALHPHPPHLLTSTQCEKRKIGCGTLDKCSPQATHDPTSEVY